MPIHNFDFHLGVDMTGREQKGHFRVLENLWRRHGAESGIGADTLSDTHGIGRALERTAGFRRLLSTGEKIYSLFHCESDGSLFIHAGKRFYRLTRLGLAALAENEEEEDRRRISSAPAAQLRLTGQREGQMSEYLYDFLPERPIAAAAVGESHYFADGLRLYCFRDGYFTVVASHGTCVIDGLRITSVTEPYAPLRLLDGAIYEQRNLLTDRYRQRHTFRESDNLCAGNAPILFVRTGKNEKGEEACRAHARLPGRFGNTLVIPSKTVVRGELCTVTEIDPNLLAKQEQYSILVMPDSIPIIPPSVLHSASNIDTVRIPRGVKRVHMEFFKECHPSLTIEYQGSEAEWQNVEFKRGTYEGEYTLRFGYSDHLVPYGIALAEKSGSVGELYFDGKRVWNEKEEYYHFYVLPETDQEKSPYTHIYVLARTTIPPYGRTLSFNARALPFYYQSEEGTHALATTEEALRTSGVETGNPTSDGKSAPEGKALLCGCRLLASYDSRLFFSGLPTIPDVIFYSHEDSEGNPNPTYVPVLNYMTDGDRMPVTGLYSAGGELCVTHASRTRGKLETHTYSLPDEAHSLFLRLYPTRAVYSTNPVRCAAVYEGHLHLLTDDGIFLYTRSSEDGYLHGKQVAGRIAPIIRAIAAKRESEARTPFFSALGSRLALFDGTDLYLGDSLLSSKSDSGQEYEWYPQSGVGSYAEDEKAFIACSELPESLREAFFIGEKNEIYPLSCEAGESVYPESETEVRTAKTLEDGRFYDHPVVCRRANGALLDRLPYRIGGTLHAPTAAAQLGGLLVYGTEDGALLAVNTDEDYASAGEAYYLTDGHRKSAFFETFPLSDGTLSRRKRTQSGSAYVFLRPMQDACPTLTVTADGRARTLPLPCAPFSFESTAFDTLAFTHGDTAALPFSEPYDYKEKSYRLSSDRPFAFLSLSYSCEVKKE